jgi:hypothetical protein
MMMHTNAPPGIALAWSLTPWGSDPFIKGVGVVCGAVIVGFFAGVVMHLVFRSLTMKKAPGPVVWASRIVGAAVAGWLLVLILFGPGGSGIGGPGGWGLGGWGLGTGNGEGEPQDKETGPAEKGERPKPPERPEPGDESTLQVEVLGSHALKKIAGESFDPAKRYRIRGEEGPQLLTLEGLKKVIEQRQKTQGDAFRRVHIVLYRDSPAQGTSMVNDLKTYVEELPINDQEMMRVSFEVDKNQDAPVGG